MTIPVAPRTRTAYIVSLAGYFLLFVQIFAWLTWISPPANTPKSVAIVMMLVWLLLPLRGILKGRPMSFVWLALISLIYMVHGMVVAYTNPDQRVMAITELVLAIVMYSGAVAYARWRGKELKRAWNEQAPT